MPKPSPLTVSNFVSGFRLVSAPVLAWLGYRHFVTAFVVLYALMYLSDWLDGRIARALHERTALGARLDSTADAATGAALLFGLIWMRGQQLAAEWPWFVAMIASYVVSCAACWAKFRKLPSYHSWIAKSCMVVSGAAALALLLGDLVWPIRATAIGILVSNLEDVGITYVLPHWRTDVPSLLHALRLRDAPPPV